MDILFDIGDDLEEAEISFEVQASPVGVIFVAAALRLWGTIHSTFSTTNIVRTHSSRQCR